MAFYDVKDVKSTLLPISLLCCIFGMGIIEYPIGHPRKMFTLHYSFTIYVIYAMCNLVSRIIIVTSSPLVEVSTHTVIYDVYIAVTSIIVGINIVIGIVNHTKKNHCIMELEDIQGVMQRMGVVHSYKRFFVSQIWQFVSLVLMLIAATTFKYFEVVLTDQTIEIWKILVTLYAFLTPFLGSTVNEIIFCNFNSMITRSFESLNSLLDSLKVNHLPNPFDADNNAAQVAVASRDKQEPEMLYSIRIIHSRLARLAKQWTQINAPLILTTVIFSVWVLTIGISVIHISMSDHGISSLINFKCQRFILLMTLFVGRLLIVVRSTVSLTSEAHRTCGILLNHLHSIASLRAEIDTFSMHLIQNPLRLTIFGLYPLNYSMLQQICASVATYLVMFVQTTAVLKAYRTED